MAEECKWDLRVSKHRNSEKMVTRNHRSVLLGTIMESLLNEAPLGYEKVLQVVQEVQETVSAAGDDFDIEDEATSSTRDKTQLAR